TRPTRPDAMSTRPSPRSRARSTRRPSPAAGRRTPGSWRSAASGGCGRTSRRWRGRSRASVGARSRAPRPSWPRRAGSTVGDRRCCVDHRTIQDAKERLRAEVHRVVVGQDAAIDLMFTALLAEGHVLLEGVPGTAKTLLAQAFAAALSLPFKRIQFTPDLMPGDVVGTNVFDFQGSRFVLTKGPVFTSVLLADEVNRTPPKTQSALLQAMQERAVTIDGVTHELGPGFMVIATQNPIEQEGTYPLPEAQLDRFLFKIPVGYPSAEEERAMVKLHGHRTAMPRLADFGVSAVADLPF